MRQLNTLLESERARVAGGTVAPLPPSAVIPTPAAVQAEQYSSSLRQVPKSGLRVPQSGNLGGAFGVPCAICFGEDGVLKTLHCGFKVHVGCLKDYWSQKVLTLCRLTPIACPAECAGCVLQLTEGDLRGVVTKEDISKAESRIKNMDDENRKLIDDLKRQNEAHRPMFKCAICLVEHEVEGCCTLPCNHRFCYESLQYHFDIVVRERRLNKLTCPVDNCGFNLRSEEYIHIFQECLSDDTYHKLLEFLTRDDPHIMECRHRGCEERVYMDDNDDFADLHCPRGHRFCAKCENGPHPQISCEARQEQLQREAKEVAAQRDNDAAWADALKMGWKPCPRKCSFGGGFKASEECDHVTCQCGFEFCWDCGVARQVPLLHDNRWHKPSCRYHTKPSEVKEKPRYIAQCPECQRMPAGEACRFPADDGYPQTFISRQKNAGGVGGTSGGSGAGAGSQARRNR